MKFSSFEKRVFLLFLSFKILILGSNLFFFEKLSGIEVFFALLNNSLVYLFLIPLLILLGRFFHIDKLKLHFLLLTHLIFAFLFGFLFEAMSYLIILSTSHNPSSLIELVFSQLHWKILGHVNDYVVLLSILYIYQYAQKLNQERILQAELKEQVKSAQLDALKFQLNPHFLFNSLNSINALILDKSEKAQQMLIKLSDFLRFSLSVRDQNMILLQTELEQIQRYLDIEKIRFEERIELQVFNNVHEKAGIPTLLLQPLIENVIKHAVAKSKEKCQIKISCDRSDELVNISLHNNTVAENKSESLGVGLENVEKRLKMNFQEKYRFTVKRQDGFLVEIQIPFLKMEEK